MTTSRQSLTVQELNEAMPTLRLKLTNKAESLASKKPAQPGFIEKARHFAENMFGRAEADIVLDTEPTIEATERNKQKLKEMFASMRNKLDKQQEEVLKQFDGLTPQQQEDILTFWGAVNEFFNDIFDWLKNIFNYVMDKIRLGFRIVKDAVKGVFNTIFEFFKMIF
jgi:hypothetical protein